MINYELSDINGVKKLEQLTALMVTKQTLLATINCLEKIINFPFIEHVGFINDMAMFSKNREKQFYLFYKQIPENLYSEMAQVKQSNKKKFFLDSQLTQMQFSDQVNKLKHEIDYYSLVEKAEEDLYAYQKLREIQKKMQTITQLKQRPLNEESASLEQILSICKPMSWFDKGSAKELSPIRSSWLFGERESCSLIISFLSLYEKNAGTDFSITNKLTEFIGKFEFINRSNFKDFKNLCFEPIMQEYEAYLIDKSLPAVEAGHKNLKIKV